MSAPVLPESWCRLGGDELAKLTAGRFVTAWQLDGVALAGVLAAGVLYGLGVRRIGAWSRARTASFGAGLLVVVVATHSSIAVYDMTLFSMHMAQHLLLIMVAPPLLVAGAPLRLLGPRRERWLRSRPVSAFTAPPVAFATYTAVIVGTHLTGLMNEVMRHPWAGQLEHLVYLSVGCQFFLLVFGDQPIRWRLSAPGRMLLLALSMAVDTFTGIVLLQGTRAIDTIPHPSWGSGSLLDTQTGGAIMWFGGDGLMVALALLLLLVWGRRPAGAEDKESWLERARAATFADHTGYTGSDPGGSPETDDERLTAYNDWLARLAAAERTTPSAPNRRTRNAP